MDAKRRRRREGEREKIGKVKEERIKRRLGINKENHEIEEEIERKEIRQKRWRGRRNDIVKGR